MTVAPHISDLDLPPVAIAPPISNPFASVYCQCRCDPAVYPSESSSSDSGLVENVSPSGNVL